MRWGERAGWCLALWLSACGGEGSALQVNITGGAAATRGFDFPGAGVAAHFVDGWELHFTRVLATVEGAVVRGAGDGEEVARDEGPWAVNLAKPGPLDARSGDGRSWGLTSLSLPPGTYLLSAPLAPAAEYFANVNLSDDDLTAYVAMHDDGHTVRFDGEARWLGGDCRVTDGAFDFASLPQVVTFSFGFALPGDCEVTRALTPGADAVAELEVRPGALFSDGAALRFDLLAALGRTHLTERELADAGLAAPVPWRTCGPVSPDEPQTGTVHYDGGVVTGLRDFMARDLLRCPR